KSHAAIVTHQLDRVAFRIVNVKRAPVHPGVLRSGHVAAKDLQTRFLRLEIGEVDFECNVVDSRSGGIKADVARLTGTIEQSQNLSMAAKSFGDLEEGDVLEAAHQLEADHVLIEPLRRVEILDAEGNFTERVNCSMGRGHESVSLSGSGSRPPMHF